MRLLFYAIFGFLAEVIGILQLVNVVLVKYINLLDIFNSFAKIVQIEHNAK